MSFSFFSIYVNEKSIMLIADGFYSTGAFN